MWRAHLWAAADKSARYTFALASKNFFPCPTLVFIGTPALHIGQSFSSKVSAGISQSEENGTPKVSELISLGTRFTSTVIPCILCPKFPGHVNHLV